MLNAAVLSFNLCENPRTVTIYPVCVYWDHVRPCAKSNRQKLACETFEHLVSLHVCLLNAVLAVLVCWGDRMEARETPTPHRSGSQKSTPKGPAELAPPEGPDGLPSTPLPSVRVACWQSRARLGRWRHRPSLCLGLYMASPWVLVRLQIFAFLRIPLTLVWAHPSLVVKKCLPSRRLRFNPWIRKVPWRRKWQPSPVFLPGRSHGQKSLRGYSSWSCKELDTT